MSTLIERLLQRDKTLLTSYSDKAYSNFDLQTVNSEQKEISQIDTENPLTLYLIISAIQQSQFIEAIPWLLDTFLTQTSYSDSYCDPEAHLFMHPELPIEMLGFVVNNAASRFSLAAVIDSLISLDSTDEVYDACRRVIMVLGDTDFASWVNFANEADYQGNDMVWLFCQRQARRVANFAKKPEYIISGSPEKKDIEFQVSEKPEDIEELTNWISENPIIFRILGPSNLIFQASDEEIRDGSADLRMFTDNRFTPEEQGEWFTGSCDRCWLKIQNYRYAVRKPLESGGWKGQYCSWNCVRLDCQEFETIIVGMTEYFEKQCIKYGIFEQVDPNDQLLRIWNDEDDVAPQDRAIVQ